MVYKEDFIYNIYCGTHVTDGVTDNMVWMQGTRMSWFNTRLGPEKRNNMHNIYCIHLIYLLYIYIYIAYICRVKSEWYINRTSFTTYIGGPR